MYKLDTSGYTRVPATKIRNTKETERFHLLEVEEFHTYYIGKAGVWVRDASDSTQT